MTRVLGWLFGLMMLLIGAAVVVFAVITVASIDVADSEGGPYVVIGAVLVGGLGLLSIAGGTLVLIRHRRPRVSQ